MIKNLFTIILCILSSSIALSQIHKSDTYLGGSLGYSSYTENGYNKDGNISVTFGKAFK